LQGVALKGRLYMDYVYGTATAPVVVRKAPGTVGEVVLEVVDMARCTYIYFQGITFRMVRDDDRIWALLH
jgi:hypothetical protein